ncbi:MAG: hypothetical protein ACRC45_03275 [Cetobacterium sp.]
MPLKGKLDLTNYTGRYVGMLRYTDISGLTIIFNRDITQTYFTSMVEGANGFNYSVGDRINPGIVYHKLLSTLKILVV